MVVLNRFIAPGEVGKTSVKLTAVNADELKLVNVIVNVEAALGATVPGENALLTAGWVETVTVSVWLPTVLAPALVLVTAPAGMVLT
jgi:hypothetical protein